MRIAGRRHAARERLSRQGEMNGKWQEIVSTREGGKYERRLCVSVGSEESERILRGESLGSGSLECPMIFFKNYFRFFAKLIQLFETKLSTLTTFKYVEDVKAFHDLPELPTQESPTISPSLDTRTTHDLRCMCA